MKPIACLLALLAPLLPLSAAPGNGGRQERKPRGFAMGVGTMPHDLTPEAVESLYLFILDHADLFAAKFDAGVPWPEALEQRVYAKGLEDDIAWKLRRPESKRVFVSATPLNDDKSGLAPYRGNLEKEPLPAGWASKDFDHPDVARAYLHYCRDLIARFRPDTFAYALEVNQLAAKNPARWKKFIPFARDLYVLLKKEHPALQVCVTLSADLLGDEAQASAQKRLVRDILPFSDLVAVTAHPYLWQTHPAKIPKDYFSRVAALAPQKPFAIAETMFPAEDSDFLGVERVGRPEWQLDWLRFCLEEAGRRKTAFVVWSLARDLDDLHLRIPPPLNEALRLFRDNGLLDGQGNPRKAFETWSEWRKRPLAK